MIDEQRKDKRAIKLLIIILIIVVFSIGGYFGYKALNKKDSTPNKETVKSTITPLLYEVTKDGSDNKMYLFGTIHAANEKDLVFPEYVLNAYNDSHYLACEFDLIAYQSNMEKMVEDAQKMLYQDGTTIKDHFTEASYNKLVDFLTKNNSYVNVYEMYQPVFFLSLLENIEMKDSKLSSDSGIDTYFLKKAKDDNKNIIEVESYDSQLSLLMSFSDELYELMINEMIDNYDESIDALTKLYDAWKRGNADDLYKYGADDLEKLDTYTEEQKKLVDDYNKKLVNDRNNEMTTKAIEYFNNNQDVFFMVGALHIIGDTGLAKQLEQNGFIVKEVK